MANVNQQGGFAGSVTSVSQIGTMGASWARNYGDEPYDEKGNPSRLNSFSAEEVMEGRRVHPDSEKLFRRWGGRFRCIRYIPIFGEPIESYGLKFVYTLNMVEFFSKGLGNGFLATSLYTMFTDRFNSTALELNRFQTVSRMGWSVKPFTALMSDAFAVFGYKKRWVLAASTAISAITCFVFGYLPPEHRWGQLAAACAFLGGYGQANVDILLEGLYARKIHEYPRAGPNLVSSIWVLQLVAGMISSSVQGFVADINKPQIGPFIAAGCVIVCLPWLVFNWLEEKRNRAERQEDYTAMKQKRRQEQEEHEETLMTEAAHKENTDVTLPMGFDGEPENSEVVEEEELYIPTYCAGVIEFNKEVLVRNWRITTFCLIMTAVVVTSAVVNSFYEGVPLLIVTFGGSAILIGFNFWSLPPMVAKPSLYGFLNNALSISVSGPFTTFFLGGESCIHNGPHFSTSFFYTVNGLIGNIAGLVGVVAFSYIFSRKSYRFTFYVLTVISIVSNIFDLIIVERWNLKMHIPDHYIYVFGDTIVGEVIYMLNWMPMVILMAQLCPRGSESMVYALLAAFSNFGQTVGSELGTLTLQYIWPVDITSRPCNFENLWKLVVLSGFAIPAVVSFPLIYFLIPSARICDELDQDGKVRSDAAAASDDAA